MNVKYLFTIFLFCSIHFLHGQNPLDAVSKSSKIFDFAISTKVGGASFFGIAIDIYVLEKANIELVRTPSGFGIGGYYHFKPFQKSDHYAPYIGITKAKYRFRLIDQYHYSKLYFPIGLNYRSNDGYFNIAVDVGYIQVETSNDGFSWFVSKDPSSIKTNRLSASLKVGLRF